MAILEILEFPDPRLRNQAKPVDEITDDTREIVKNMLETMYDAKGIGLASIQVNIPQQIIVMDLSEERNEPQVFINPSVTVLDETLHDYDEGCLSIPGFYETIQRPCKVLIEAKDDQGQSFQNEAEGLLAVCIQHEMDHLNGKLFVDYLSPMKRNRIRKKMEKKHRSAT